MKTASVQVDRKTDSQGGRLRREVDFFFFLEKVPKRPWDLAAGSLLAAAGSHLLSFDGLLMYADAG